MKLISLTLCLLLVLSCKNESPALTHQTNKMDFTLPDWAKSANIYEVNIRQFTPEGTINAFSEHLPRLKEMGVDILWFMPIFPISTTKMKGSLGSYYSVTDFQQINPAFGTMEDVDKLIAKIHELDMKIILDWVPNHTGWDHVWLKKNKDWYTQDSEGNVIDPHDDQGKSHGWTDVADLNYNSKDMRKEMLRQLQWWVKEKNIDGYRMDIAFGVPDDFWHEVRDSLYAIKPIFMLAESENASHRNDSIFHSTYGWNLFHAMNDIAKGEKSVSDFIVIHGENATKFERGGTLVFTSNHDENAWNGTSDERLGESAEGWAVVMALLDGFPLIYGGMEEPMVKRLEFFEKDTIGFEKYALSPLYTKLFQIKHNNEALWNSPWGGKAEFIGNESSLLVFKREVEGNVITVIFNPSKTKAKLFDQLLKGDILLSNTKGKPTVMKPNEYIVVKG